MAETTPPKKTKNFTPHGIDAEYTLINDREIVLAIPRENDTVKVYFNFADKNPTMRVVVATGKEEKEVRRIDMTSVNDDKMHQISQAYMALRSLGGDPFGITSQVNAGKKAKPASPSK